MMLTYSNCERQLRQTAAAMTGPAVIKSSFIQTGLNWIHTNCGRDRATQQCLGFKEDEVDSRFLHME